MHVSRHPGRRPTADTPGIANLLLIAMLAVAGAASGAFAAEFGARAAANGYFMLFGDDALQAGLQPALGDIPHRMTLYIEVPPNQRMRIDLYDPGLYNPANPNWNHLDGSFDTAAIGEMTYTLISPNLNQLKQQVFGEDTNAWNEALVRFYDSNNDPFEGAGTYMLVCEIGPKIGVGRTEDVSVFGVSIRGFNVYSYNYCIGYNNMDVGGVPSGATITDPITLYPLINYSVDGTIDLNDPNSLQVSGLDFVNLDMDAAQHGVAPPNIDLITRRGSTFTPVPAPSTNSSFWPDHVVGTPVAPLDSDDLGIWTWQFFDVGTIQDLPSTSLPAPFDLNAFSIQVCDYGFPDWDWMFNDWPYLPWWDFPNVERHPRRIYLPADNGAAPVKEEIGHSAVVIAGSDPITETFQSTLRVTFTMNNPNAYDMTFVEAATYVAPFPYYSDINNLVVPPANNIAAAINGADPRRIDLTGVLPAGVSESFTYEVDVTPPTDGIHFLNGDGDDFSGQPARQTLIWYTTPVNYVYGDDPDPNHRGENLYGPVPSLFIDAEALVCSATAVVTPDTLTDCPNTVHTFNGGTSEVLNCIGGVPEYQWYVNGIPIPGATNSSITGPIVQSGTLTLEVKCSTDPVDCIDTFDVPITVYPAPPALITPADPVEFCPGQTATLTLTNPGDYTTYTWTTTPGGHTGDNVSDTPSIVINDQDFNVTYRVTAQTPDGCEVTAEVTTAEQTLAPPVITPADPVEICPGTATRIETTGTYASCSWSVTPGTCPGNASSDCFVDADVPGCDYTLTVTDAGGCQGASSVSTVSATDNVPASLGNVLLLEHNTAGDITMEWVDLTVQVTEYWIAHLDADSDLNGQQDMEPDAASLDAAPDYVAAPGAQTYTENNGINAPSFLVFYNIRATSLCFETPGSF